MSILNLVYWQNWCVEPMQLFRGVESGHDYCAEEPSNIKEVCSVTGQRPYCRVFKGGINMLDIRYHTQIWWWYFPFLNIDGYNGLMTYNWLAGCGVLPRGTKNNCCNSMQVLAWVRDVTSLASAVTPLCKLVNALKWGRVYDVSQNNVSTSL